jgi:hypothetical protein
LRAASAKGALFQLSLLASVVDELQTDAEAGRAETSPADWRADSPPAAFAKANRLLYSVAGYLEAVSGVTIEDAGGDFWMARRLNPFDHLSAALALAEEEELRGRVAEGGEQ